ncbi:MAG: hypothetical protein JW928_08620 [Candidatus Aureabacteria bacterium]|nr:hypothetical protein [Candidatus Auribacterota bacterium]
MRSFKEFLTGIMHLDDSFIAQLTQSQNLSSRLLGEIFKDYRNSFVFPPDIKNELNNILYWAGEESAEENKKMMPRVFKGIPLYSAEPLPPDSENIWYWVRETFSHLPRDQKTK